MSAAFFGVFIIGHAVRMDVPPSASSELAKPEMPMESKDAPRDSLKESLPEESLKESPKELLSL